MKKLVKIAILSSLVTAPACLGRYYYGTGDFVGTKSFKGFKETSWSQVTGKSCRYVFPGILSQLPTTFPVPAFGEFSLNAAYQDALEKSPAGTDSLSNVKVGMQVPLLFPFGIILDRRCIVVEAYPAKITDSSSLAN